MTTIEIIDYLKAMEKAEITEGSVTNNSEQTLWFLINGVICRVDPHTRMKEMNNESGESL